MNLVEISETLKGVPDDYLVKHVQAPDGSVPQYMALAELQRRQDMRARFAQQQPQSTVADDATKGIMAGQPPAPPMPPQGVQPPQAPMPPQAPQGFAKGGAVEKKDDGWANFIPISGILQRLGLMNADPSLSGYAKPTRIEAGGSNFDSMMARNQRIRQRLDEFETERARARMAQNELEKKLFGAPLQPVATGYKDGGPVDAYISRAGRFESGNNRNAKNPYSTATGRFQLLRGTRRYLDKKYGFDPKDMSDETEVARMKAYTGETISALEKAGIPITGGTLYGGHFLGQKGITDFFQAYQKDPSTGVEQFFSADVIKKNPAIFNPKGRPPRRTLADVMTKFDEVGGGRSRTPIREEDSSMGVAMQVAQRADRGDVGPGYEDANMQAAYAMAQDLESSPKMTSRMALLELLDKGKPAIAPVPQYQIPVEPNIGDQIKAQLLERYTNPGIMAGAQGFSQGGMVKGYEDGGPVELNDVKIVNGVPVRFYNPMLLDGAFPAEEYASGVAVPAIPRLPTAKASDRKREDLSGLPPEALDQRNLALRTADWAEKNLMSEGADRAFNTFKAKNYYGSDYPALIGVPANIIQGVNDLVKSGGGLAQFALGTGVVGGSAIADLLAGGGPEARRWAFGAEESKPPAKPPAARPTKVETNINKFLQTALAGPSGTFETSPYRRGIAAGMEPPATGDSIAPTAQTPVVPAAPPAQRNAVDVIANQFLNEMKAAQSSKEDMRNMALLQAGLGMMAGQSPFFATNVGQGAMAGLQAYQQAKAQNQQIASEAMDNMLKARALELDKRRVDVSESSAQSEADYRNRSLDLQAQKIEQDVREFLSKGAAGISQEDLAKMANDRIEFARKEQTNPLSQYYNKTDVEIENMVRADLMRALNIAKSASGGVAVKKMGSAI